MQYKCSRRIYNIQKHLIENVYKFIQINIL